MAAGGGSRASNPGCSGSHEPRPGAVGGWSLSPLDGLQGALSAWVLPAASHAAAALSPPLRMVRARGAAAHRHKQLPAMSSGTQGARRRSRIAKNYGPSRVQFAHVVIDDHSRLAYVEIHAHDRGEIASQVLTRAVAWMREQGCGPVQAVMSDNAFAYTRAGASVMRSSSSTPATSASRHAPTLEREGRAIIRTLDEEGRTARSGPHRPNATVRWHLPSLLQPAKTHTSLGDGPPISRFTKTEGRTASREWTLWSALYDAHQCLTASDEWDLSGSRARCGGAHFRLHLRAPWVCRCDGRASSECAARRALSRRLGARSAVLAGPRPGAGPTGVCAL